MQLARSGIARNPRGFGRGPSWHCPTAEANSWLSDDLRLFATTFVIGFAFVSIFIA